MLRGAAGCSGGRGRWPLGRAGFRQPPAPLVLGLGRRSWSAQPSPLVAAGSNVTRARQDPCSQPGLSGLSLHFSSSASTGRALTLSLRLPSGCWPAFSCPLPSLSFLRTPPALSGRAGSPVGVARSEGSADCGGERDSRSFVHSFVFPEVFFEHIWCSAQFQGNIEVNKTLLSLRCGRDGNTI